MATDGWSGHRAASRHMRGFLLFDPAQARRPPKVVLVLLVGAIGADA
jgi:hypothetical protein